MSFEIHAMSHNINVAPMEAPAPQINFNTGPDWQYHDEQDTTKVSEGAIAKWTIQREGEDEEAELMETM